MASTSRQPETEIVNAFDGLAPPFPPASTSATQRAPFDVFINHRGPDVKHRLATDIYNALHAMGLKVFLDSHDLQLGDRFPEALEDAMSRASLHVAIFSPTYAQSPWCLAELYFMLKTGAPVIPVFYQVQPDDLRHLVHGKGIYVASFSEHEKKGRYSIDKLERWKMALHNVSFHKGETVTSDEEERSVVKNIVNRALKLMERVPLEVATHPVGLEEIVADFERTISEYAKTHSGAQIVGIWGMGGSHSGAQIVGIWGMGGSGKTTLAKELYNKKYSSIHKSSFVFDIRNAASKNELHIKQRQLLTDLGYKINDQPFDSKEQGKNILSNYLRSLPVFVILDDVDHRDQLEALLPGKASLASGSLVIVTTRDKEVLKVWGTSCVYDMKSMNQFHAKQLFCWHSFLQPFPLMGFENLVEEFVCASHGLPLSLKVFGAQLYGFFDKGLWKDLLHKISRILPDDIINILRISYDALDKEEKQMFLDIACFFIGVNKMTAITVWEGSGWSGLWGWQRLENKCLVELVHGNEIRMHDHLRDLGREIASTRPPSRIWSPDQFMVIHKQEIRGMVLNAESNNVLKFPGSFLKSRSFFYGLKVFVVANNYRKYLHIVKFSRELAWLSCTDIDHIYLPSWMPLKNLRVLELHGCQLIEGLWKDEVEVPVQLRELIVSFCPKFRVIPKFIGYLENLKKISLCRCSVESLPEEFCRLQSLEHVQLKSCIMLSSLPSSFGHLTSLRHLDLEDCRILGMLPDSCKQLKLLQHLHLEGCDEFTLQSDILENMSKLEYLNLNDCEQFRYLPRGITNQASLRELYLNRTGLREIPINIGQLSKLRVMEIGPNGCSFHMQSLPDSLGSLTSLERLVFKNLGVKAVPKSLKQLINLQSLDISNIPISGPFTSFWSNLKQLSLERTRVSEISISSECCPGLKKIALSFNDHLTEVDTLPTAVEDILVERCTLLRNISGISGAVNLQYLRLKDCPELKSLASFDKLVSLKVFELSGDNKVETVQGLQHCTSLEELQIEGECSELLEIEGWMQMQRLRGHVKNLRWLKVVAKKRSVVERCIQTIQKWPEEIIICKKAVTDAVSILESSAFPNLYVVSTIAKEEFSYDKKISFDLFNRSSDGNAMMLCLVINCFSPAMQLRIRKNADFVLPEEDYVVKFEEGKWAVIGVFTQHSEWFNARRFRVFDDYRPLVKEINEVEKGMVVTGEEESVVEGFHRLFALLSI